jgi:hypothetical protein
MAAPPLIFPMAATSLSPTQTQLGGRGSSTEGVAGRRHRGRWQRGGRAANGWSQMETAAVVGRWRRYRNTHGDGRRRGGWQRRDSAGPGVGVPHRLNKVIHTHLVLKISFTVGNRDWDRLQTKSARWGATGANPSTAGSCAARLRSTTVAAASGLQQLLIPAPTEENYSNTSTYSPAPPPSQFQSHFYPISSSFLAHS